MKQGMPYTLQWRYPFDNKIKYARYKDKYFFSNDENVAQLQTNKEIRREYAEKIDELGYDRKEYGIEEEM